ncbi:hypothetical protein IJ847_01630 [Candidatus Saccharibacteria bacterium]|nr:hypothetical protein [Candidatus Saccharibacteria bacterium]
MFKTWWRDYKKLFDTDPKWLSIWLTIYFAFLMLDLFYPTFGGTSIIKYAGIFSCIVYVYQKNRQDTPLILALLLTFLADTILVWTDMEVFGVIIFVFAQFMHILRQSDKPPKDIIGFSIIIIFLYAFARQYGFTPLYVIGTIYAIEIMLNLALSAKRYSKHRNLLRVRCGLYGFLAFIACDTCVGLRHLALDGVLPPQIIPITSFLVWFFYFPSQVLLANSSTIEPKERKVARKSSVR